MHVVGVDTSYLARVALIRVRAVILGSGPVVGSANASVDPSNTVLVGFRLGPVGALSDAHSCVDGV